MFKRIAVLSFIFLTVSLLAGCGCCEKCCCMGKCCCIRKDAENQKRVVHKKRIGKHLISCPGCGQKMVQIPTDDDTEVDTFTIEAIAIPIGPVQGTDGTAAAPVKDAKTAPAVPANPPVKAPAAK